MRILAIASLAASFALATSAHAAVNLLANGSFESGIGGWAMGGSQSDGDPARVIDYNSASFITGAYGEAVPPDNSSSLSPDAPGDHAFYFVSDASSETLSQSVFLQAGTYNLGFSAYIPLNGSTNPLDAIFTATFAGVQLTPIGYTVAAGPVTTWTHFTGVATILASGNYSANFAFGTNGDNDHWAKDIVIDRAYITSAVPEPATWGLMITGFGLAGAALRRRRRALAVAA